MYDDKAMLALLGRKGIKITAVAHAMGITASAFYRKRKGESDFTRSEIQKFAEFLDCKHEVNTIFFAERVT